jgi:hypothetical protein
MAKLTNLTDEVQYRFMFGGSHLAMRGVGMCERLTMRRFVDYKRSCSALCPA